MDENEGNEGIDWARDDFSDIIKDDDRYDPRAYALTSVVIGESTGDGRHISGQELLERFRDFVLDEFGPMSFTVLADWGVNCCADVGEIVFNLVESGRIGKTESDSRADFIGGYDFREAFLDPYVA